MRDTFETYIYASLKKWIQDSFAVKKINEKTYICDAPFLDVHNDYIRLFIIKQNCDDILITDNGYLYQDTRKTPSDILKEGNINISESIAVKNNVSLNFETGAFEATCKEKDLAECMMDMYQALQNVSMQGYNPSPCIEQRFAVLVGYFLKEKGVNFKRNSSFKGKSSIEYKFEFSLEKKNSGLWFPMTLLPDNNDESRMISLLYSWPDITSSKGFSKDAMMIALSKKKRSKGNQEAIQSQMASSGIALYDWNERNNLLRMIS